MKILRTLLILSLFFLIHSASTVFAQDETTATALWQITKFDITVNAPQSERALAARAVISARNVGRGAAGDRARRATGARAVHRGGACGG